MIRTSLRTAILLLALSFGAGLAIAQNQTCPRGNCPAGKPCPTACPRTGQGPRACPRANRGTLDPSSIGRPAGAAPECAAIRRAAKPY
jgi:hypothetical protein